MTENHKFEFLGLQISLKLIPNSTTVWTISHGDEVLSEGSSAFFNAALGQALTEANRQKEKPYQLAG